MQLYVIRHADAGAREEWQGADADRRLSELGQRQARTLGETLRQRGVSVDAVVSSPLVRARETAQGLIEAWVPGHQVIINELLSPGARRRGKLSKQLAGLDTRAVAIVGHDPDLAAYLGWLLGIDRGSVPLAKAGAALVNFEDDPAKGEGQLVWVVTPEWFMPREPAGT